MTIGHLPEFEHKSEYLFLVGDIGTLFTKFIIYHLSTKPVGRPGKQTLEDFFAQMQPHYQKIFFVPGNHEYYRSEYHSAKENMKNICDKWDNVVFMDRTTVVEKERFRLIGASLVSLILLTMKNVAR